jgi:hypothetical protein
MRLSAQQSLQRRIKLDRSREPSSSGTGFSRSRFSAYASTDRIIDSVVESTLCMGAT